MNSVLLKLESGEETLRQVARKQNGRFEMMRHRLVLFLLYPFIAKYTVVAADERVLFDFEDTNVAEVWRTVNDRVMGGRSIGRIKAIDSKLEFFGTLSLENNGGFASIRALQNNMALSPDETVVLRVRGDGRQYQFNLFTETNLGGYSYRQPFDTQKGQWIEVRLPVDRFLATWRGREVPDQKLSPKNVKGMGFLLGDKKAGPFKLEVDWIRVENATSDSALGLNPQVTCEGIYPQHLQGVCTDGRAIYWSFTTVLVKTDANGKVMAKIPVATHHGDLCHDNGKLFVAVNLGKFNDPNGNADSWVYVYDAESLRELAKHQVQEVFHGAGGIGIRDGRFFVVGGLPDTLQENYVYEYDADFQFQRKHTITSGHTHLGIQTATFAHNRWWFGCYGSPRVLLVTDRDFQMIGRYERDCSLGVERWNDEKLLIASGTCEPNVGCTGLIRTAVVDEQAGYRLADKE